ncbi:hypothetical protein [Lacticaseibacillus hegangensis]|uniref:Lipoprotein n=1 Tax=Lacticaseibacillus hegangensis TaxID=2486010 RepID=A0ABW4D0R6_9LACO|nr:hypothetical protein [Lacticaseibacillus hegangensis]
MNKIFIKGGLLCVAAILTLSGCGSNSSDSQDKQENSSSAIKASSGSNKKKENSLSNVMNQLARKSVSTGDVYVTGKMSVGSKNTLKPGIYDMKITGGSGNIMGDRKEVLSGMPINWIGSATASNNGNASIFRIILMEGDSIDFSNISKVNFTAVPEKITPTNELGQGNYVVNRDIKAGTYKLSTNVTLDPEYENLGWDFTIYDDKTKESRNQRLTSSSNDVVVELKEGEIITTSFDATGFEGNADSDKLIFTPINQ